MEVQRDERAPGRQERRGEHNELHYYDADEEQVFDERGSQTEEPGEDERSPEWRPSENDGRVAET